MNFSRDDANKSIKKKRNNSVASTSASATKVMAFSTQFNTRKRKYLSNAAQIDDDSNTEENNTKRKIRKKTRPSKHDRSSTSRRASKRTASSDINKAEQKDPELDLGQPLAKRMQKMPSAKKTEAAFPFILPPNDILNCSIDTPDSQRSSDFNEGDVEDNLEFNSHLSPAISSDEKKCKIQKVSCDSYDDDEDDDVDVFVQLESNAANNITVKDAVAAATTMEENEIFFANEAALLAAAEPLTDTSSLMPLYEYGNAVLDLMSPLPETMCATRQCPLPALAWANADDVWALLGKKDISATGCREARMLERHPGLQPRMRAILLDWLIEVCEVYKMDRETYYLAVDFLDRYLTSQRKVPKTHLQLIGITCLFIAAKVEEIYPPKIGEFAYVTDGACTESDILKTEIMLLQALGWNINPVTVMGWLGIYMQLNSSQQQRLINQNLSTSFLYPQFSGLEFAQTALLLDLCTLDVGFGAYSYAVLAASAMCLSFDRETALRCSGLSWSHIEPCVRWMLPFFDVASAQWPHIQLLEQNEQVANTYGMRNVCPNMVSDDSHIIQTHNISLALLDRVQLLQEHNRHMQTAVPTEASPATIDRSQQICIDGLLTPPASGRKPPAALDEEDAGSATEDENDAAVQMTATTTSMLQQKKKSEVENNNVVSSSETSAEESETDSDDSVGLVQNETKNVTVIAKYMKCAENDVHDTAVDDEDIN